jgi:hypothetical protein
MAQVGRPEHDLREEPRQGRRLERDGLASAIDRRPSHPAAATEEVDHAVAAVGQRLDAIGDERG